MIKELCGKIDHKTYYNINKYMFSSGVALTAANMTLHDTAVLAVTSSILITQFAMKFSHYGYYTKDINVIRDLYSEFITNYSKLNNTFNLTSPIQIQTMFRFLLERGFLSKDKNFNFSDKIGIDIHGALGISVINGSGCCRHISGALTDILNNNGIKAYPLAVYCNTEKKRITRIIGNHQISFAIKDGNSYFLDPSNDQIYTVSESRKGILFDENDEVQIKLSRIIYYALNTNRNEVKKELAKQYPSIQEEKIKELRNETLMTCKNNQDIFENFYNENKELYDDISNKILTIKKTNKIVI